MIPYPSLIFIYLIAHIMDNFYLDALASMLTGMCLCELDQRVIGPYLQRVEKSVPEGD